MENRMDRITNLVNERVGRIIGTIKNDFKDTNPYRTEKITSKMQIDWFTQKFPEQESLMRQQFGDEAIDEYVGNISKLMRSK